MEKEVLFNLILSFLLIILLLTYCFYVIYSEKKKFKYYKKTIYYETEWDKYHSLLKVQRKVILKKKIELFFLNLLVKIKELGR